MPALFDKQTRRNFLLERSPLSIGRSADNRLVVLGREVSRHHCELRKDVLGRWVIKQLGSSDAKKGSHNVTLVRRGGKVIRVMPGRRPLKLQDGDAAYFFPVILFPKFSMLPTVSVLSVRVFLLRLSSCPSYDRRQCGESNWISKNRLLSTYSKRYPVPVIYR